jgi:alcohol dehydrogenase, propanol-preferring
MASIDIPKQQRAAVKVGSGSDARAPCKDVDVQMPGPDQILVKINWSVPAFYQNRKLPSNALTGLDFAPQTNHYSMMNGRHLVLR